MGTFQTFEDLTGQQFKTLEVLELIQTRPTKWRCRCTQCGNVTTKYAGNLKSGHAGCRPCAVKARTADYDLKTPEYETWKSMKQRCYNAKNKSYPRYGGKGTRVCDRWLHSFPNFLEDMGPKPSPDHSIDRIDSASDYTPENCRWLPLNKQSANRRSVLKVTWQGRTQILKHWAEELGLNYGTVHSRWWRDGERDPERLFRPA